MVSNISKGLLAFGENLKRATKINKCLISLAHDDRIKERDLFSFKYRRLRGNLIEVIKFIIGR